MTDVSLAESTRRFYDAVARRNPELPFLNYGYATPGDPAPFDPGISPLAIVCRRLYEQVLMPFPSGLNDVVEIGCGRGGGAYFLLEQQPQLRYLGLDLSPEHIRVCRARFTGRTSAHFSIANATRLPVPAQQFDAAFSVEAAHHFGDLDGFYRQVARALRPGGWFFLTGIWRPNQPATEPEPGPAQGFEVIEREDISPNVVVSLARTTELRKQLIASLQLPERFQPLLLSWAGVVGYGVYQSLVSGSLRYLRFRLRRVP
jgi:SAM-dependent methyltransferase